jgi:hypothetical protein
MRHISLCLFIALFGLSLFSGCRKDPLDEDADAQLLFSQDTLVFDTVFTTVGSSTRQFKIYNTSRKALRISSIKMGGGAASPFRMNVDGSPVFSTGDLIILGGDSMYVFVDVTVDPNNANSPLMIQDSILFETNGNLQTVILNAVGQDAYFHYREAVSCGEIWGNDKPHVIYGYAYVPSCCLMTIQAGARVHLHNNSYLIVDSCATLRVLGTQADPVKFEGDRLEPDYAEEPGQWGFIWFSSLSKDNVVDWAEIKNGSIGIVADTMGGSANPTVRITNTKIRNMALMGIFGRGAWMEGENLLITNCAQYCAAMAYGGKYEFRHCTFANYWDIDVRSEPTVLVNNYYETSDNIIVRRDLIQANFYNCIIYGNLDNELGLDSSVVSGVQFNRFFSNCIIKSDQPMSAPQHFQSISTADPAFVDRANNDWHLSTGSPAIDAGDATHSLLIDLDNFPRPYNSVPDLGAFEWHP